jgi:dipeptidyl aminopeptidase/acylaminoacyl peptidase
MKEKPSGTTTLAATGKKADTAKPEAKPEPLPLEIGGYALSPDGKSLALWARDPETPGEKKQKEAKADASWVNHELHATRLYLASLKPDGSIDGALQTVAVEPDVHGAFWSPAGDRLAVLTEKPNGASDLGPANAVWLVTLAAPGGQATPQAAKLAAVKLAAVKLDGVPATVGHNIAWRPDGGEIVFSAQTPDDAPPGVSELFALPMTSPAANAPRRLSANFSGELSGSVLYYTGSETLVADAGLGTRLTPVAIPLDAKSTAHPAIEPLDLATPMAETLTTNLKQTGWAWIDSQGGQTQRLCFAPHLGGPCEAITTPDLTPSGLRWIKPQLVQWKRDGFTIDGLLYLPPDGSSAKTSIKTSANTSADIAARIPLIVDVHGGPHGAFQDRNDAFAAFLIGHGWAILRPNPRGSSNYGTKFAAANKNDLGGGDYLDIMAGVDAVLAKFPLDPSRMALMGYSYGGEMAGFVEGKTDRFKAIISGAPVIDQFSEYGTEGDSWYDRWYYGKPWEHFEDAWRQSPLSVVAHAKTPFLLLQGDNDTTDPRGQSDEMYRALRQAGVPVEMVAYPRENHGPLAVGIYGRPSPEPWHGFDARQHIVDFLDKAFAAKASAANATTP